MGYITVQKDASEAGWFATRRTGLTATDIARLDTGGARVRAAIKAEKAGYERHFTTRATEWGKEREPILAAFAADMFGMEHNTTVLAAEADHRWLATPDLIGSAEVGDIKTTVHDWNSWDDVPRRYITQLRWQRMVTGRERMRLVYEPHHNFIPVVPFPKTLVLEHDPIEEQRLLDLALSFQEWDGEPDADAAELDVLLRAYADAKELADDAAADLIELKAKIEDQLGGPRSFIGSVGSITRSPDGVTRSFDSKRFQKDRPGVFKKYLTETPRKGALRITIGATKDED